jgi:hypothetical protein
MCHSALSNLISFRISTPMFILFLSYTNLLFLSLFLSFLLAHFFVCDHSVLKTD